MELQRKKKSLEKKNKKKKLNVKFSFFLHIFDIQGILHEELLYKNHQTNWETPKQKGLNTLITTFYEIPNYDSKFIKKYFSHNLALRFIDADK